MDQGVGGRYELEPLPDDAFPLQPEESERRVVRLGHTPFLVEDHNRLVRDRDHGRDRQPFREGEDLRHAEGPHLHLPRGAEYVEVPPHGVLVLPERGGDLGDGHALELLAE